ncbi:hypothetical protein V8D89_012125, partial [Ganoderma adspersum]
NRISSSLSHIVEPNERRNVSVNFLSSECSQAQGATLIPIRYSALLDQPEIMDGRELGLNNRGDAEVVAEESQGAHSRYSSLGRLINHPCISAEFKASPLTHLPLAPPLVVQLESLDSQGKNGINELDPGLSFLVAHLSLMSSDGESHIDDAANNSGTIREQLLYGNLVSSVHVLQNLEGKNGVYFLFPDVSVRSSGRFLLKVKLICLPWFGDLFSKQAGNGSIIAEAQTLTFDVYQRREYIAPTQTPLTQHFLQQGTRMYVSKCARDV